MIILASQSPRRHELMKLTGLPFTVRVADIDETMDPALPVQQEVTRVSRRKAQAIAAGASPDDIVIAADRLDNARVGEKVGVQVVEFDRVVGVVHLGQILGFGNVLALALLFERICDLAVCFGNAAGFLCGKIAVIMLLSHSNSLLSQRFIFGSNASRRPSPTKLKPRTVSIRQMPAGIQMNQ